MSTICVNTTASLSTVAMPNVREIGKVVIGDDNNPTLEEDLIEKADCTTPRWTTYWRNLIKFDELNKTTTATSVDGPEEQQTRMKEMREQ